MEKRGEEYKKKNTAYNQQRGHLLCLPGEGVNDGNNIIEHLVLTWGETEHAEEENSTPKRIQQQKGCTTLIQQNCKSKDSPFWTA